MPACDDTFTMRPPSPCSTIRSAHVRATRNVPVRLTSTTRRNSSAGTDSSGAAPNPAPEPDPAPALEPGPPPDVALALLFPGTGGVTTVEAGAALAVTWSESLLPGRAVASRTLAEEVAPGVNATACSVATRWTAHRLAVSGTSRTVALGTGGGLCYRYRLTVVDSAGAWATALSGTLFAFKPGGVVISGGAVATGSTNVQLALTRPTAGTAVRIADTEAGLAAAPLRAMPLPTLVVPWSLPAAEGPHAVWVRFEGEALEVEAVRSAVIILDRAAPSVVIAAVRVTGTAGKARLLAIDLAGDGTGSPLALVAVSSSPAVTPQTRTMSPTVLASVAGTTAWVRVRDGGGNWSPWVAAPIP